MHSTRIIILSALLIIACCISCNFSKRITYDNYSKKINPPNCVPILPNFYYDQTEITNLSWLEYEYWTMRVFGINSREYEETLIDSLVWYNTVCNQYNADYYLRHPAYRDYPLVGISQSQAKKFARWRSDRVFEQTLVQLGVLEYNPNQNKESHFTLENYLSGKYLDLAPDTNIKYYIKFRLPTQKEWELVNQYSDSLDNLYFNACSDRKSRDKQLDQYRKFVNIPTCKSDSTFNMGPTRAVYIDCVATKGIPIYNLDGNVSEWLNEENIFAGRSWTSSDSSQYIGQIDTSSAATHFIGFRCVAEWVKIEYDFNKNQ